MCSHPTPDSHRSFRWIPLTLAAVLLAGGTLTACTPADEPEVPTAAELEQFRDDVIQALDSVRTELQDLQERVAEEAPEEWRYLSTVAEVTREEVISDLERLTDATAEEAEEVRRAAARRLAELEAGVVQGEVKAAADIESLTMVVEHHLAQLQGDLSTLGGRVLAAPTQDDPAEAERAPAPEAGDMEGRGREDVPSRRIEELEDEIQVIQQWADRLSEFSENGMEPLQEDLGRALGEVTRKVRILWYSNRWNVTLA
jgi:TolA-binding protein